MGKVSGQTPENTPEIGSILFLHSGKPPRRSFRHYGKLMDLQFPHHGFGEPREPVYERGQYLLDRAIVPKQNNWDFRQP
ncbi:MAG: hypothetical protein HRT49_12330 [Cognatishimia sp.]|nr:hypothetical protein [Cognatishimia sp.]